MAAPVLALYSAPAARSAGGSTAAAARQQVRVFGRTGLTPVAAQACRVLVVAHHPGVAYDQALAQREATGPLAQQPVKLMLTTHREMEHIFAMAAECDVVHNQVLAAIAPAVFIENRAASVPVFGEERVIKPRKLDFPTALLDAEDE